MKLSDYVFEYLADLGVKHVFMLPGGACMHLVDSLGSNPRIEHIVCLHEQACAFAAEGYAEYKNDLGVALVTAGPGGTNAVTGVAAAWVESAPCLVLSGQAKRADLIGERGVRSMGQQELDIVSIVRPITKYAVTVLDPATIRYHLEKAVYLARHGRRGPVWLDLPLDVQAARIEPQSLRGFDPAELAPASATPPLSAAKQALALLDQSKRPVILVGNGVKSAGATEAFHQLLEVLKIPVLTTWKAADILPENHPLYAGRPGSIGQRGANFVQQNADCLLVLGARLDLPQTAFNHAGFAPGARKIMVDIDPTEIRKMQTRIEIPVVMDAGEFVKALLQEVGQSETREWPDWLRQCQTWKSKYPVVLPEHWNEPKGCVSTYALMDVLSDQLEGGDVLVPGSSGPCSDIFMQAFRVRAGQRICNAPGLGAMGTGLPGAIGVCLASGRKPTVCINGDGGFQLNIQELETIGRLKLPIKFFVLDNGGYGSIQTMQRGHFEGRLVGSSPSSGLTLPDVGRIAAAYGLQVDRIVEQTDLRNAVRAVLRRSGPVVCIVKTSPEERTMPRVQSALQKDGSLISKPMEDMWPYLSPEDLQSNMSYSRANQTA
jgi:acetolactate synthase-1/2/3 large subunit